VICTNLTSSLGLQVIANVGDWRVGVGPCPVLVGSELEGTGVAVGTRLVLVGSESEDADVAVEIHLVLVGSESEDMDVAAGTPLCTPEQAPKTKQVAST